VSTRGVPDVVLLQSSYYSKLEKADVLELTVKYLNSLKRQRVVGTGTSAETGVSSSPTHL